MKINLASGNRRSPNYTFIAFTAPPLLGIVLGSLILAVWQLNLSKHLSYSSNQLTQLRHTIAKLNLPTPHSNDHRDPTQKNRLWFQEILQNRGNILAAFNLLQQSPIQNLQITKLAINGKKTIISGKAKSISSINRLLIFIQNQGDHAKFLLQTLNKKDGKYNFSLEGKSIYQ